MSLTLVDAHFSVVCFTGGNGGIPLIARFETTRVLTPLRSMARQSLESPNVTAIRFDRCPLATHTSVFGPSQRFQTSTILRGFYT
jgi:hypothetical protein